MDTANVNDNLFLKCYVGTEGVLHCCFTEDVISQGTLTGGETSIFKPRMFEIRIPRNKEPFYRRVCRFVEKLCLQVVSDEPEPDSDSKLAELCKEYFQLLVILLNDTEMALNTDSFEANKRFLEEFYFIGCQRDILRNQYLLPAYHPILSIHFLAEKDGRSQLEKLKDNSYKYAIAEAIVSNKARRDKEFLMFSSNQVYQVSQSGRGSTVDIAELFQNARTLIKVEGIRLIEKVEWYIEEYRLWEKTNPSVSIAVFGRFGDDVLLKEYIKKQYRVDVNLTCFERVPEVGEYVFCGPVKSSEEKGIYDLFDYADIETLYNDYSIVLFLTENYFYKQHQVLKNAKETWASSRADWYVNTVAAAYPEFKDKAVCYNQCYNKVGSWINTYDDTLSGTLQFDEKLFKKLGSVEHPATDIYLYIKYGESIGEYDLFTQNVCNDELYDGYPIMVYNYDKHPEYINEAVMKFIDNNQSSKRRIFIDIWKLVKSLGNDYWLKFARGIGLSVSDDADKVECIRQLKQIQFYIDYTHMVDSPSIKNMYFGITGAPKKITDKIAPFVEAALQFAFVDREKKIREKINANLQVDNSAYVNSADLPCVHKYLRDLLVNAIISSAGCIQDVLFAYLLHMERYEFIHVFRNDVEDIIAGRERNKYTDHTHAARLIYWTIVKLEELNLRSLDNPVFYFTYEFKNKISQNIDRRTMARIMKRIGDACRDLKYESNILFYSEVL